MASRDEDWQCNKSLTQCLLYALDNQIACDVTFKLTNQGQVHLVNAHRTQLAMRSPVFFAMFHGDGSAENRAIEVNDVDHGAFKQMLRYVYSDDADVSESNGMAVLYAARKYGLPGLADTCLAVITHTLATHNVCHILQQALHLHEQLLLDTALHLVQENTLLVFKTPHFLSISQQTLRAILESPHLSVHEIQVFRACVKWATCECERQGLSADPKNQRGVLGDVLYLVNVGEIPLDIFTAEVVPSGILSDAEELQLFREITGSNTHKLTLNFKRHRSVAKLANTLQSTSINARSRGQMAAASMRPTASQSYRTAQQEAAAFQGRRKRVMYKDHAYHQTYDPSKNILKAIVDDDSTTPQHWKKFRGLLKGAKEAFSLSDDDECYLVKVDPKTYNAVEQMMTKTWKQSLVGHGKDAQGISAAGIKITDVLCVENPRVYREYHAQLKIMCKEALLRDFQHITSIMEPEIETATIGVAQLDDTRIKEINEYFLFHGIQVNKLKHNVIQGLDCRLGGNGLFGKGIYFAESSTKADQYSDPWAARHQRGTELVMIIARVLMGNIWRQKGSCIQTTRPPCMISGCHKVDCHHPHRFHSVMGTHNDNNVMLNFREFVLYDTNRAYPEYVVKYKRL